QGRDEQDRDQLGAQRPVAQPPRRSGPGAAHLRDRLAKAIASGARRFGRTAHRVTLPGLPPHYAPFGTASVRRSAWAGAPCGLRSCSVLVGTNENSWRVMRERNRAKVLQLQ